MAKRSKKDEVNDLQERFCREYLVDFNGFKAAIRAGYSEATAQSQSSRLLRNVKVSERISDLRQAQNKRVEIRADDILRELLAIATADISLAFHAQGALRDIHDMPPEIRKAIAGVDVYEEFMGRGIDRMKIGETKKIKFWDKVKALELLGKHLKIFTENHVHSAPGGGKIQISFVKADKKK